MDEAGNAIKVLVAVSEAVRGAGQVPSGVLYAALVGVVDLPTYEWVLGKLIGAGLIKVEANHLIRWVGPVLQSEAPHV